MARDITRTVSNRVAGQIAADIGKSLAGGRPEVPWAAPSCAARLGEFCGANI